MSGFSSDASEIEAAARDFHAAGIELSELDPANTEAGRVVIAAARPPRVSGALAAGLQARATGEGIDFASSARYWTFVEWGAPGHNVRAQPFYAVAIRATTEQLVNIYAAHAIDSLKKVT